MSRTDWEVVIGLEVHAQLNTASSTAVPVIRIVVSIAGSTPARSATRETPALRMNRQAPSTTSPKPSAGRRWAVAEGAGRVVVTGPA